MVDFYISEGPDQITLKLTNDSKLIETKVTELDIKAKKKLTRTQDFQASHPTYESSFDISGI